MPKRRKKKREKKRQAAGKTLTLPRWYKRDVSEWSTEEILTQLKKFGLEMDEEEFRRDAENCLEPYQVAEKWTRRVRGSYADRLKVDFFHFSALELWNRFLPHRATLGPLSEELLAYIDHRTGDWDLSVAKGGIGDLMRFLDRLNDLLEERSERTGTDKKDLVGGIFEGYGLDMVYALVSLPFELHREGLVDEAISVARRFAFVDEGNMLGDLGQILAMENRCEEAITQAEQNIRDLSDDPWVIIKAGDVYDLCGRPDRAMDLYKKALEIAKDQSARDGAFERLIPLYRKLGKNEEARAVEGQWKGDHNREIEEEEHYSLLSRPAKTKKIGRNDPCPCGSGLKYKKCCINKR